MDKEPAAFLSYVRFDDQHEGGKLSQLRERLSAEVQLQTGREFWIFQDRNDIAWGQHWKTRLDETLDAVTLLIPIITPSFFQSPACREEVERFLDRERRLGRQDLILPVYYVSTPELDDAVARKDDELARVLATRQYADWRELRFEPLTSPLISRAIAQLAGRLRDTFWHPPTAGPATAMAGRRKASSRIPDELTTGEPASIGKSRSQAKQETPTHIVDPYPRRGDFTSISAAVEAADPGDRILIRPGLYQEGVVLEKPLELLGDGPMQDIEIRASGQDAILFRASIGRVANLTLRQMGGEGKWNGVDIAQGRLDLEGCDISSRSHSSVIIHEGADPRIRRNRIHSGEEGGIFVYSRGLGTLEDNDISNNEKTGVMIMKDGDPILRRNRIRDNQEAGVLIYDNGRGTLEDNDITGNKNSGIEIKTNGNPIVRNNRINRNQYLGILVNEDGRGVIEDNDLTDNAEGSLLIAPGCENNVRRNNNRE
jgi:F-box protein 11